MISGRIGHLPAQYATEPLVVHSTAPPSEPEQHEALPCVEGILPSGAVPHLNASDILFTMANNILQRVIEQLFVEAIPLPPLRAFKVCREELLEICKGNGTLQRKLEELESLLGRLGKLLGNNKGVMSNESDKLKTWLDAVRPWIKRVSQRWATLEQIQNQPSLLGKTLELVSVIQELLAEPHFNQGRFDVISQSLDTLRRLLSQVLLWQQLPPRTGLVDYLGLVMSTPQLTQQLDVSLLQLGQALTQTLIADPYPAGDPLSKRLYWISQALTRPEIDVPLRAQLVSLLGGSAQADLLLGVFRFTSRLCDFPANSGPGEQALWLLRATPHDGPEWPWLRQFQAALGVDSELLSLLNRLLTFDHSAENWALLMRDAGKAAAPGIGLWAAGRWLPTHVVQTLETFYRETPADESWTSLFQRMATGFITVAKPYLMEQLMRDPLCAATVQYAEALQNHNSWEQTLQWFTTQAQGENSSLLSAYGHYLNARLACQIFNAFNSQYPEETEDRLRLLARQLKDCQLVRYYPQFEKLIDLLPLLPALREIGRTLGGQPDAGSWIEWGNQWLNSLSNSDNNSVRELRERLSHQVETWLADAIIAACDSLVQQPWGLLPVSEAASIAQPGTHGSRQEYSWAPLAGGVCLEAAGLAAIGYALWKVRQDEIASSDFAALWQQKAPLLLGIAAMSVGSVFLYSGTSKTQSSSEDIRQLQGLISELEVDDLYFVFNSPQFAVTEQNNTRHRVARSSPDEEEDEEEGLMFEIEEVLHNQIMSRDMRTEYQRIFDMAKRESDVLETPPGKGRDIRQLLKTIELLDAFVSNAKNYRDMNTLYPPGETMLHDLQALADRQTNVFRKAIVQRFRQSFINTADTPGAVFQGDESFNIELAFQTQTEHVLKHLASLYHPILNPVSYIDDYICKGITAFEKNSGFQMNLRPDSKVRVHYYPIVPADPNLHIQAPVEVTRYFTLVDIVIGHYLYESKKMSDPIGREYKIRSMQHQALIDDLTAENLQSRMKDELQAYRNTPNNAIGMKSFYHKMIILRCLDYLSRPHQVPIYQQAVKEFLEGKITARTVSFHDTVLNGVFLIPAGPSGGVMFCVDEDIFIHLGSYAHRYWEKSSKVEMLTVFPQTSAFEDWVLRKIPARKSLEQGNNESAFKYQTDILLIAGAYSGPQYINKIIGYPFTFSECGNRDELVNNLYDGLMARLNSDIDTLVFSYPEQITDQLLEMASKIISMSALAISVIVPGTGSVLARLSLFLTSLTMDALYIGTRVLQAQLTDRPELADSFRDDAIIAGVLGSLDLVTGGIPLVRQTVKRTFLMNNVNQSIQICRSARAASRRVIPRILSEMNWSRLDDNHKVNVLLTTLRDTTSARRLAQLTNRDVVRQSIRNNLLLDFEGLQKKRLAWGTYAAEQASAQRRLNSDLIRLIKTNDHLHHLFENPPGILRQMWLGTPLDVATDWIASNSRSAKTVAQITELKKRIKSALMQHHSADLLDIGTIESLHNAVYQPVDGHPFRAFRSSSDPVFMGSDIARSGFLKMLLELERKNVAAQMNLADSLYAAVVRYHPFGDGNGRTARAIYALARLQKGERPFMALSKQAEDILNPPGALG